MELSQQHKLSDWEIKWEKYKHLIEPAVDRQDLYTLSDVRDKIAEGSFLLWTGTRSAMITEFVIFPRKTICNLIFCGGDLQELLSMTTHIEQFAKDVGCSRFYGGGRPGWLRKLKQHGWKSEFLISKELT